MQVGDRAQLHTTKRSSGLELDDSVQAAWQSVRDSGTATTYCILTYPEDSKNTLTCSKTGTGGVTELIKEFKADVVMFCGARIVADGMEKFVLLSCIGENVGGMAKGRASLHKQTVSKQLDGIAADIQVSSEDEIECLPIKLRETLKADVLLLD